LPNVLAELIADLGLRVEERLEKAQTPADRRSWSRLRENVRKLRVALRAGNVPLARLHGRRVAAAIKRRRDRQGGSALWASWLRLEEEISRHY
jgi:hypothetical protein